MTSKQTHPTLNRQTLRQAAVFITTALSMLLFVVSCTEKADITNSPIIFKGVPASSSSMTKTVAFTSNDIKWLNGTTGEINFIDSKTNAKLCEYYKLDCYLGEDSLFTVKVTSDIMSSIVNDLVLNLNSNNGNYYFADGYPAHLNDPDATILRAQNKQKRADAWALFIAILKTEKKYKN
jgi:hypothetical protein